MEEDHWVFPGIPDPVLIGDTTMNDDTTVRNDAEMTEIQQILVNRTDAQDHVNVALMGWHGRDDVTGDDADPTLGGMLWNLGDILSEADPVTRAKAHYLLFGTYA